MVGGGYRALRSGHDLPQPQPWFVPRPTPTGRGARRPHSYNAPVSLTYRQALDAIIAAGSEVSGMRLGLDRTQALMTALGEPQRDLRELTSQRGVVLIFDEVITGFRYSPGGAQQVYGVTPDLTTLAKIIAGGLPGGAVVGKKTARKAGRRERDQAPRSAPARN